MIAFHADIRLTVRVPFKAKGETDAQRIAAAKHAESKLVAQVTRALAKHGVVVDIGVAEVSES